MPLPELMPVKIEVSRFSVHDFHRASDLLASFLISFVGVICIRRAISRRKQRNPSKEERQRTPIRGIELVVLRLVTKVQ